MAQTARITNRIRQYDAKQWREAEPLQQSQLVISVVRIWKTNMAATWSSKWHK